MLNYLKSSISISSYDGCTICCKYCILSGLSNYRSKVRKLINERDLVNRTFKF